MPFNSISFLIFFSLFLVLFYCTENEKFKSFLILGGSFTFYAYINIFNLFFLFTTIIATYIFSSKLMQIQTRKNFILFIGVSFILLQLIFVKYWIALISEHFEYSNLKFPYFNLFIIPIGISFYSLQAISLLADIRSGKYNGSTSLKTISLFLSFFPQSLSGPIHRATDLIPQFSVIQNYSTENIIIGFKTILWGYTCKLIIADKIDLIISPIFSSFHDYDGFSLLISTLIYSFQIYFDFFGYSLIAIGLGRVLGFRININFLNPYSAKSFKDFWHRWHISLSNWMRDYIYIPLGGKDQKHYFLFCITILITFLISGFWHGATRNFIIWGALHAFLYLSEDLLTKYKSNEFLRLIIDLYKPLKSITFFILISLTWLVFRTDSFYELSSLFIKIISFPEWTIKRFFNTYGSITNLTYLSFILTLIFFAQTKLISRFTNVAPVTTNQIIIDSIFICTCLLSLIFFGDIGGKEFLYFRF